MEAVAKDQSGTCTGPAGSFQGWRAVDDTDDTDDTLIRGIVSGCDRRLPDDSQVSRRILILDS